MDIRENGYEDGAQNGSGVVAAPLAEQVFNHLRSAITNGDLPPGHRLRVREVAAQAGTSIMPVRIAISQLVEAGLATQEPYKGARVSGFGVAELVELYDLRILLESEAARLGARNADGHLVSRMVERWELLQQAAARADYSEALQLDEKLLGELYASAGSNLLVSTIHGLWDRSWPYKVLWLKSGSAQEGNSVWRYKPQLIEAARQKDGERAAEVIGESYEAAKQKLHQILDRTQSA
ncbi:MAG: GntR family transcriptional regulator [Propionibacteriaceae bacterium]|nr:GntR family transcriptional regulator [Propionibacteriaceae bacterium]